MKLCITCIFSRRIGRIIECVAPGNMVLSPIDGQRKSKFDNGYLREVDRLCGPAGAWHEAREASPDQAAREAGGI